MADGTAPRAVPSSTPSPAGPSSLHTGTMVLTYRGLLNSKQIEQLRGEFGEVPIIPGFSGPFGREDLEGHVLIPGASRACYETRKTLKRWKKRAAQEAEGWYGDLQQNNLEVIKISHLLDGLDGRLWKAQRDLNKRHVRALESRRRRMRQREAALAPLTAEHEVAAGLVSLARSSAKRGTSTGAARKLGRAAAPA